VIISSGRVIYEHILTFLPEEENISFVAYHKLADSFLSHRSDDNVQQEERIWVESFSPACIFRYELRDAKFPTDLLIITDIFNHLYHIHKLDILSLCEYTVQADRIEFDYPLFDGKRDYSKIMEMIKEANE
jgi:hypothetical protein